MVSLHTYVYIYKKILFDYEPAHMSKTEAHLASQYQYINTTAAPAHIHIHTLDSLNLEYTLSSCSAASTQPAGCSPRQQPEHRSTHDTPPAFSPCCRTSAYSLLADSHISTQCGRFDFPHGGRYRSAAVSSAPTSTLTLCVCASLTEQRTREAGGREQTRPHGSKCTARFPFP